MVGRLDHQFRPTDLVTARYYINDSSTNNTGTYGIPAVRSQRRYHRRPRAEHAGRLHAHLPARPGERPALHLPAPQVHRHASGLRRESGRQDRTDRRERRGLPGFHDSRLRRTARATSCHTGAGNPTVYRFQTPILDRQILDSLSWYHGKHAFKFGVEYRAGANDEIRDRGSAGNFTISPLITDLPGVTGTATRSPASCSAKSTRPASRSPTRFRRAPPTCAFYAQDDWRVTDRLTINARPALGSGVAAQGGRQQDELVRPAGDQSGVRHSRRGHLRRSQRHAGARLRHRHEQLRTAPRLRLPPPRQARHRDSRRRRHLLRTDRQQHHRRCGLARLLDFRQLFASRRPTRRARFHLRDGFPAVIAPAADARLRRRAAGPDAQYLGGVLQSPPGGADFLSVQPERAARDRRATCWWRSATSATSAIT